MHACCPFCRLDQTHKGYIDIFDWGHLESYPAVETFTLMYMRRFMGLPSGAASKDQIDSYLHVQSNRRVKSLAAAIKLVEGYSTTHGSGRRTSIIDDTFRYIDGRGSGCLDRASIVDGFMALGVNLADTVADDVMRVSPHMMQYHN